MARGIAALLVICVHASTFVRNLYGSPAAAGAMNWAHAGVDIFFVISGFVITWAHHADIGRAERLPAYAWRRFVRIYPFYWFLMLFIVPLYILSPTKTGYEQQLDVIMMSMILLPQEMGSTYAITWTLSYEMLFYILFGMLIINRIIGLGLMIAMAIGVVVANVFDYLEIWPWPLRFALNLYILQFLGGVVLAFVLKHHAIPRALPFLSMGLFTMLVGGMVEVYGTGMGSHEARQIVYGISAMMIIGGLAQLERDDRVKLPLVLSRLGSASYSLYLTHVLVLMVLAKIVFLGNLHTVINRDIMYIFFVGFSVLAGVMVSQTIELPLIKAVRLLPLSGPSWGGRFVSR